MILSGTPQELALRLVVARLLLEAARNSGARPSHWLDNEESFQSAVIDTSLAGSAVGEQMKAVIREVFQTAREQGAVPQSADEPGLVVTRIPDAQLE